LAKEQIEKDNFSLALLLGTLGGFLLFLVFTQGFPVPLESDETYLSHLFHYQSLIAGIIAAVAAGGTVWAILNQIEQQENYRKNDLLKKSQVADIALLHHLPIIENHVEKCAHYILEFFLNPYINKKTFYLENKELEIIIKNLEFLIGPQHVIYREILEKLQILTISVNGVKNYHTLSSEYYYKSIEILFLCFLLYGEARQEKDSVEKLGEFKFHMFFVGTLSAEIKKEVENAKSVNKSNNIPQIETLENTVYELIDKRSERLRKTLKFS